MAVPLGTPPPNATTRQTVDYRTLVAEAEGKEWPEVEWDEYEFSKKTTKTTARRGVYSGTYPD